MLTPVLLTSRAILFSTLARGAAQRDIVLNDLANFIAVAERVKRSSGSGLGDLSFGDLHIVFRDYALDVWDSEWHKERMLDTDDRDDANALTEAQAATAAKIKKSFRSISGKHPGSATAPGIGHSTVSARPVCSNIDGLAKEEIFDGRAQLVGDTRNPAENCNLV